MDGPLEIVPGVYGMGSAMVNWYLVEQDGRLTAVDAGLSGFAGTLESDLAQIGRSLDDLDALVLTHSDADHTGLAKRFHEAGARVLVHERDDAALRKPRLKKSDAGVGELLRGLTRPHTWKLIGHIAKRGGAVPGKFEGAETYTTGELDVPGRPLVIETPGHTAGHCALLFAGHGALFVGDAMCTMSPLSGAEGPQLMPPPLNVDNVASAASLGQLEGVEADVLLPGHGQPWRGGVDAAVQRARSLAGLS